MATSAAEEQHRPQRDNGHCWVFARRTAEVMAEYSVGARHARFRIAVERVRWFRHAETEDDDIGKSGSHR